MTFVYYFLCVFAIVLITKTFLKIIEPNQILYIYTEKVIDSLVQKGYGNLSKVLGGCDLCFTFHLSWIVGYFVLFPLFISNSITFGYTFFDVLMWLVFPSFTITLNAFLRNLHL